MRWICSCWGRSRRMSRVGLWRRVEGRLAARATTVPITNAADIALVAKRVGKYQHQPRWGPLLDQLWVR